MLESLREQEHQETVIAEEQYQDPHFQLIARWNFYSHAEYPVDFLKQAMARIQPKETDTILDVGCSYGQDLLTLRNEYGFQGKLIGMEKTPEAYSIIGRLTPEQKFITHETETVEWLVGDAVQIPLKDNSVDVLLASRMLYHVPEYEQALREFGRVVKPNGHIVVTTTGHQNKLRHRKFEEAIALFHGVEPPTRFTDRFPAELAEHILPKFFTLNYTKRQITRARFDDETIEDFFMSLLTMKPSFHPRLSFAQWEEALAAMVEPHILREMQLSGGHFTDIINQQQFFCRNTKPEQSAR